VYQLATRPRFARLGASQLLTCRSGDTGVVPGADRRAHSVFGFDP
jgi:hypothetical protein